MKFAISHLSSAILVLTITLVAGCAAHPQKPPATPSAMEIPLATTQPSYWLDQPGTASVQAAGFAPLWNACEEASQHYLFKIDRADYRAGVMTTVPMVSAQWFEPWRWDAQSAYDRTESSLATIRRTIRFEFTRLGDGAYQVVPKVLVERQSVAETRITSVVLYRSFFTRAINPRERQYGTRESDVGIVLAPKYWYPIRRDEDLENAIAQIVRKELAKSQAPAASAG